MPHSTRARCARATRTGIVARVRKLTVFRGRHNSRRSCVLSSRVVTIASPMATSILHTPTAMSPSRGTPISSARRAAAARASLAGDTTRRATVAPRVIVSGLSSRRDSRVAGLVLQSRRSGTRGGVVVRAAATPNGPNTSAADAVNNGLRCFEQKKYEDAVGNFTSALSEFGTPTEDECRAALYNRACAYCKLQKYDEAKTDLTAAVNEYSLKFSVVLKDSDMEVFRGTPQYEEMADEVKGFRSNASIATLKAEAQEPFRFFKLYAFGGLGAGAFIGLIIILTRLSAALAGGEDAPDLGETIGNLLVNVVAIGVFGFLFKGEIEQRDLTQKKVAREEEFGRLRIVLSADADEDVLVSQLRGNYRLFVIAGSKNHVDAVVANLNKYKTLLKEKNVVIATLYMENGGGDRRTEADPAVETKDQSAGVAALAAEFAAARRDEREGETAVSSPAIEFGKRSKKSKLAAKRTAGGTSTPTEKRWRVAPVDTETWRAWVINEIERSGFDPTVRDVFFSVGKDGTLWKSGAGTPNWMKLIEELPEGGWTGGV